MKKFFCLILFATLTACSSSGSDGTGNTVGSTGTCSNDGQKQFVLQALYDWYLWNDLLPANINTADYSSPEQLVTQVTLNFGPQSDGQPVDLFSSVGSAQADQEFFGEGKFEGFGFSWRIENNQMRIVRVFAGSPVDQGDIARGDTVLTLNGRSYADINSNEGVNAFFDATDTVIFEMQPLTGASFSSSVTKDIVTIDPIPQSRIIVSGGQNIGYIELSTFISTADAEFDTIFAAFRDAGVNKVILDLRYNGGGLVSTAELLGDYFGGFVADNLIFSSTEFNADRAADNNSVRLFNLLSNSLNLSQLVVVATRGTASASEMVTNGMAPHVDVAIVGDDTFGKPVGQIGLTFCEKILRPTAFRIANADGNGDYFDGLPVDCPATDDLDVAVGAANDPNLVAALSYLNSGACPVTSVPPAAETKAPGVSRSADQYPLDPARPRPAHREFLDAY